MTDELDRRVLSSYLNKFYCEDALAVPGYLLSPLPTYYVPDNGPLASFKDYILTLPAGDRPEAFGQHPNAEISYLIEDSKVLLDSLLSLQPRQQPTGAAAAGGGGGRREDVVMAIATDLLDQVPQPFNLEEVMKAKADDPSALHVVLFQEVERYNALLVAVRRSCVELQRGIKGLVVMSADLDLVFDALYNAKVHKGRGTGWAGGQTWGPCGCGQGNGKAGGISSDHGQCVPLYPHSRGFAVGT